jgi:hypothetical protein
MHVCKATIQDYEKKYIKNSEQFPDFWDFFLQKMARIFKLILQLFDVLPEFDQINIFQKCKRHSNIQQKMFPCVFSQIMRIKNWLTDFFFNFFF